MCENNEWINPFRWGQQHYVEQFLIIQEVTSSYLLLLCLDYLDLP